MNMSGNTEPIVVYRLGHMGDVALTTGVLAHWHEKHGTTFVFITRAANAPLFEGHPGTSEIIGLDNETLHTAEWFKKSGELAKRFAGHPLLDLHDTVRSRILSLRWKGKVHRYRKFSLTRRLYDKTHAEKFRRLLEATNVPQRYALALDKKAPRKQELLPRLFLTEAERQGAETRLTALAKKRPLVGLHPYATHPAKQWPRSHWENLTGLLAGAGIDWFVIGRDENPLFPDHEWDFTNQTNLRETCALLAQADLMVTGDSGPMHLACGVQTPVLAMFGPTSRVWGFQPAGPDDHVLELDLDCRPCSLHGAKACTRGFECMAGITPENIMENIRTRIKI